MTPKVRTPAGRGAANNAAAANGAGHRRTLRPKKAPHAPRRVSGPVRGRAAAATRAGAAIPAPRWVPGRRSARPATREVPLSTRAFAFLRGLPDHRLLDRVVRGRAWIPLLGVMLAGIVAMQVEVLKLGANIGRSIERSTALQSRNEVMQAYVASLADDQRIERLAAGMGMVMPAPTAVGFLRSRPGDADRAAASIHAPDPASFQAALAASQAAATPLGAASASGAAGATGAAAPTTPVPTGSPSTTGSAAPTGG